jgi:DNA-binding GntR family transcriptional regulator
MLDALPTDLAEAVTARAQVVDDGFHALLVNATGNDLLIQAHAVNAIRIRLIRLDRITLTAQVLPEAFGSHLAIIDAIGRRDAPAAVAALETHILNARERATKL